MNIQEKIKAFAEAYAPIVIGFREHLHANPELSFEEYKTSKYVQEQLQLIGIESRIVSNTGVVAEITGNNPSKKTIALRADLDALPITEKNEVKYKSKNEGVMHACGHDVHTSCLLGAAKILQELKEDFEGTVRLIFQPGEEKLPGGASLLIKEGVLKNPDVELIFAQHVFPELEAGKVGFRGGMYMASTDEIYITVKGKGGHGAMPHLNIDPVLTASHLVISLQQLVSRMSDPTIPSVLSFGKFIANGATNVIPSEVKLEGTFRTLNEEWRNLAHQKIEKLANELCQSMGASCEIEIKRGYPFLENNIELTAKAKNWATDFLGNENVVELPLRMTAEDFAFYSHHVPACFYRLGVANNEKGINAPVHNPHFDIDPACLKTGIGLMAFLAYNALSQKQF